MKKNIIKITIILLFFIAIFIFNSDCFANSSAEFKINGVKYKWNDLGFSSPNYLLAYNEGENRVYVGYSTTSREIFYNASSGNLEVTSSGGRFVKGYYNLSECTTTSCGSFYEIYKNYTFITFNECSISNYIYTNQEYIKDLDGNIVFKNLNDLEFNIELSTTEYTSDPIIAYTDYFPYEYGERYKCYISSDGLNFELMNYETLTDNGITKFRFNYKIISNGAYYFILCDNDEEIASTTWNVTNIIRNANNSGFTDSGIPQPFIDYEVNGNNIRLKTQSFTEDEIQRYECLHTTNGLLDYSEWNYTSCGAINNEYLGTVEYYFFIDIPINENTPETEVYHFVFYDYTLNEYGYCSSFNFDYKASLDYIEKVSGVVEEKQNRFDELINFFKERFGFLTFPFEFIADLLNRILNIEYSEPIINIPELHIPGSDIKIFNGYSYNFNTLLENNVFSNIYNIYLIAVDFIIVIGVIILAYNTLMEVFGNG